jgi:hypothetical protein
MKAVAIPMRTVVGLFDDRNEAMRAYTALVVEGYAKADLDILTNDDQDDEPRLTHMRQWVPEPDVSIYLEGVRRGGTIITAYGTDSSVARAAEIMSGYKMINIKKRGTELEAVRRDLKLSDPAKNDNVLEVIEEEVQVGREIVERGRMRIYSVPAQREVQQEVRLRDETLRVRRRPVNRSVKANPDLFRERSFVMVEMDEIAKVGKTARVVEVIKYAWERVRSVR